MSLKAKRIYEFGAFRLDAGQRLLFQNDEPVPLPPKVIETLVVLVENGGQLIEKEELLKRIWPDTFVEENNLNKNVSALRKALGEGQDEQRFIETIPRRGYRFVAEVKAADSDETEFVIERSQARVVFEEEQETDEGSPPIAVQSAHVPRSLPDASTETALLAGQQTTPQPWWRQRKMVLIAAALLACALAAALLLRRSPSSNDSQPDTIANIKTIAVLPFQPLSAEGRDEFLELGMADALITKLSNVKRIVVRPTSAIRPYANLNQDALAAGRALQVSAVLTGTVQRLGDTLRATVQLINVADGRPLWAEKFDTKFTDIFAVQDAISERVAGALALRLTGEERERLAKRYTENSEAQQLYQKGRYFLAGYSEEAVNKAVEYFKEAIAHDPNYALAFAGLADANNLLVRYTYAKPEEKYPLARTAALKAIELDGTLAEAYAALAQIHFNYDWDWTGAERDYRKTIELNPNYAEAHTYYGFYLLAAGKLDEGLAESKRAQELNPVSLQVNTDLITAYVGARQYDQAIEQARKTLELDPEYASARLGLGRAYFLKGMYAEAVQQYEQSYRKTQKAMSGLAQSYARAGRRADALRVLNEMLESAQKQESVSYGEIALVYVALNEPDKAIEMLEKAFAARDYRLLYMRAEARFDPIRSDPRFSEIERHVGLKP